MRRDGRGDMRRPAGTVLRPLALLLAAAAVGFGMWRALMDDDALVAPPAPSGEQLSHHVRDGLDGLVRQAP